MLHGLTHGGVAATPVQGRGERLVGLGIDVVAIAHIAASLESLGARFEQRMYTEGERAYAHAAPALLHERLAARFAAKEAAIKALSLSHAGVDWREIEVAHAADGAPVLRLHGKVRRLADEARVSRVILSLSHDGPTAAAVVAAVSDSAA